MFVNSVRWRRFVAENAPGYEQVVFLEGLLDDTGWVSGRISAALATATGRRGNGLRLRGFRDSEFDFRLTEALSGGGPAAGEGPTEWLTRSAGGRAACVAVNDISAWDLELAAFAQSVVRSLVPGHDLVSGADIYTFIADVEWTPFGVHKDNEPSLILHLGPGSKELWVWPDGGIGPEDLFENPSLGGVSFDFDRLLPGAQKFTLNAGDFVCIPQGRYHLFRNAGASVFLGITLFPPDPRKFLTTTLTDHLGARLDAADGCSFESIRELTATMLADPAIASDVSEAMEVAAAKLRTTGYLRPPKTDALREGIPTGLIGWAYPGVIEIVEQSAGTRLIARGREIKFGGAVELVGLSTLDGMFTIEDVTAGIDSGIDKDRRRQIAKALWRFGALERA